MPIWRRDFSRDNRSQSFLRRCVGQQMDAIKFHAMWLANSQVPVALESVV